MLPAYPKSTYPILSVIRSNPDTMNYFHYFSAEVLTDMAGFGINFHFGTPAINIETGDNDQFWGVKAVILIFDLRLGVITSEQ